TSTLVIFHVFALPLIRLLGGEPADAAFTPRRSVMARLDSPLGSLAGREDYVRVTLATAADGSVHASPVAGGSGDIVGFVRADGLIHVAADVTTLGAGDLVRV